MQAKRRWFELTQRGVESQRGILTPDMNTEGPKYYMPSVDFFKLLCVQFQIAKRYFEFIATMTDKKFFF